MAKMAKTLLQLAKALGRSKQAVHAWTKRAEWNQSRRGPWSVEKARRWAAATLGADRNPDQHVRRRPAPDADADGLDPFKAIRRNPLAAARLRKEIAAATKLELQSKIISGEWVPRAEAEAALILRITRFKADLEPLGAALAARWGEIDNGETLKKIVDALVERILTEYARGKLCQHIKQPRIIEVEDADDAGGGDVGGYTRA